MCVLNYFNLFIYERDLPDRSELAALPRDRGGPNNYSKSCAFLCLFVLCVYPNGFWIIICQICEHIKMLLSVGQLVQSIHNNKKRRKYYYHNRWFRSVILAWDSSASIFYLVKYFYLYILVYTTIILFVLYVYYKYKYIYIYIFDQSNYIANIMQEEEIEERSFRFV